VLAFCALFSSSFFVGCASSASRTEEGAPASGATPSKPAKPDSGTVGQPTPPPVVHADSTSPEPRPQVLVEGIDFAGVRTRLIPHVMGRGWMLSVNKSDSIEFVRPADPELSQAIFGIVPPRGTRVSLRFRLTALPHGTRIEIVGHLLGSFGPLPYRASADVLAANLEDLRHDLLTAPVSTEPQVDRIKK
jgi:hypothetical protein